MKVMNGWKGIVVSMAAFGLLGCASVMPSNEHEMPLQISSTMPAAEGQVQYRKLDDGQTQVKIRVDHLAPPAQAAQGATTYVAWLRPGKDSSTAPIKLGALELKDNRKGKLDSKVGYYEDFEVFITAEPNAEVSEPSGQPMMNASVSRFM